MEENQVGKITYKTVTKTRDAEEQEVLTCIYFPHRLALVSPVSAAHSPFLQALGQNREAADEV